MKKMLLIGAMLVLGATSFAQRVADLNPADSKYSGGTKLDVLVKGEVVDSNKNILVITPITNAGADGTTIEFNFGEMKLNSSATMVGKFKAEVFKAGEHNTPIDLSGTNIYVGIANGDNIPGTDDVGNFEKKKTFDLKSIEDGTKTLGKVTYELGPNSGHGTGLNGGDGTGLVNAGKTFEGIVTATTTLSGSNTGTFKNTMGKLNIAITNIQGLQ